MGKEGEGVLECKAADANVQRVRPGRSAHPLPASRDRAAAQKSQVWYCAAAQNQIHSTKDAMTSLTQAIQAIEPELVELRHAIHRFPEPGFEETETQARLQEILFGLGIKPVACAKTGLVADLGSGQGPTVALRADIDCLRMTEENPGLPYRSSRPGLAHMCGHDGHTAMLVGAAKLLAPHADSLPGRVRLIFQPAEEGPGGAPVMVDEGALEGVDEIYGLHNWPTAPLGSLRVVDGPTMAHVCTVTITIHGKGGHASQPHSAVDPVLAGAHVVTALQSIVARNIHYKHSAVVSITNFHGGEVHNVIPDSVTLEGSIRVLDDGDYELIEARIRDIATSVAGGLGATVDFHFDRLYPVLHNHPAETEHVRRVGARVFGEANISSDELPMLGAEDFAFFTRERPGCYFFLGTAEAGRSNAMCHATHFDFNDRLLPHGVAMWVRLCEDRLGTALYD